MSSRPTIAEIDLAALRHNVAAVQAHVGAQVQLLASIKANGYGHGAVPVARAALAAGVSQLGVATVDEGIELRAAGITAPILLMSPTLPEEAEAIVAHRLQAALSSLSMARALAQAAATRGVVAEAQLKVDTGLGRFGVWHEEAVAFVGALTDSHLQLVGVYTHLATADEPDRSYAHVQLSAFRAVVDELRRRGYRGCVHAANSAAAIDLPESRFALVRTGLILLGAYPSEHVSRLPLQPVMKLTSRIALVRELPAGRHLSYGRTFTTTGPSRIATVPIGYADGYRRAGSNCAQALVRATLCPVVGRICMDQLLLDLSGLPQAAEGDEVVLWGADGLTVESVARTMNTVPFELLCGVAPRVPRVYRD